MNFVVTHCEFRYNPVDDPENSQTIFIALAGPSASGAVHFVESARSGIVTTDFQLDHIFNRSVVALVVLIITLSLWMLLLRGDGEGGREGGPRRAELSAARPSAAPSRGAMAAGTVGARPGSFGRRTGGPQGGRGPVR